MTQQIPRNQPVKAGNDLADEPRVLLVSSSDRVDVANVKKIVWNELLAYVHFYRNKSNAEALRRVVLCFFSPGDIADAKRLMVKEFESIDGVTAFLTERRNSAARAAQEAEVEDIVSIFDVADAKQELAGYVFMSADFDRIPKFGPEELNVAAVVDRQLHMEASLQSLAASVQQLSTSNSAQPQNTDIADLAVRSATEVVQQQLGDFNRALNDRFDHLNAVCAQLAENVAAQTTSQDRSSPRTGVQHSDSKDRSMNIVMFGVPEDRTASVWRQKVEEALTFVSGHTVDCIDMFRLGRFVTNKVRPIVVKLRSAWDKRLVLSSCSKLKNFGGRIFIAPDESLEVRRKRIFDRIKSRAVHDGKDVAVTNGVLSVDGINVFSLKDGKITQDGQSA